MMDRATRLTTRTGLLLSPLLLAGCLATAPKMGEDKGTVSGAAGGAQAEGQNSQLEKCDETLGTIALQEDTQAPRFRCCA
jgi:hypothetical protein